MCSLAFRVHDRSACVVSEAMLLAPNGSQRLLLALNANAAQYPCLPQAQTVSGPRGAAHSAATHAVGVIVVPAMRRLVGHLLDLRWRARGVWPRPALHRTRH